MVCVSTSRRTATFVAEPKPGPSQSKMSPSGGLSPPANPRPVRIRREPKRSPALPEVIAADIEAQTTRRAFLAEKRLEDVWHHLRGNAGTAIRHQHAAFLGEH